MEEGDIIEVYSSTASVYGGGDGSNNSSRSTHLQPILSNQQWNDLYNNNFSVVGGNTIPRRINSSGDGSGSSAASSQW